MFKPRETENISIHVCMKGGEQTDNSKHVSRYMKQQKPVSIQLYSDSSVPGSGLTNPAKLFADLHLLAALGLDGGLALLCVIFFGTWKLL